MARSGSVSGRITVAEAGASPDIAIAIAPTTGTVTGQASGKRQIAASQANQTLVTRSAVVATGFSMVYIKGKDATTGDAKNFTVNANGNATVIAISCSEYLFVSQTNSWLTDVLVTTEAGNTTEFEYVCAGA